MIRGVAHHLHRTVQQVGDAQRGGRHDGRFVGEAGVVQKVGHEAQQGGAARGNRARQLSQHRGEGLRLQQRGGAEHAWVEESEGG